MAQKCFGLTAPISLARPDAADMERTKSLKNSMQIRGVFETEEELGLRNEVLRKLDELVKEWIRALSLKRLMPQNDVERVGGRVCLFGSYALGAHIKGAIVDAICVVPKHIQRQDFFSSFVEILECQPEVSKLRAIPKSYVPVIKMSFDGIDIHMTFARLGLKEVNDDLSLDPILLRDLDEKCINSILSYMDTQEILNQVPNKDAFHLTLQAIKLWAQKRGIYSNVLGYLGGVSWAILVARVCQLYPNADPSTLVQKFFLEFKKWQWPQPVLLKNTKQDTSLGLPVWDPRQNRAHSFHVMPIITPSNLKQNTTFSVTKSTLKLIQDEFTLSLSICNEIIAGKASWDKLFEMPNFFGKYNHFVVVEASAKTEEDQLEWYTLIETKLRHLILNLEREPIEFVQAWPKPYPSQVVGQEKLCCHWFIGLVLSVPAETLNLTYPIKRHTDSVMQVARTNQVWKNGMRMESFYRNREMLAQYLPPEERNQ